MNHRKNILFITSDQQHWDTLNATNDKIKTPNLNRLCKSGVRFERAYCANQTCTPSRATMITGLPPSRHGAYSLGTKLPEDVHTVGEDFSAMGYRTTLVGKAHFQQLLDHPDYPSVESNPLQQDLEFWRNFKGPFYGFDDVELCRNHADEYHVGQHYAIWMEEQGFDWKPHFWKPAGTGSAQKHNWTLPEEYHYNRWIGVRTCDYLEEYSRNNENFFHWASFPDPHPPYLVSEPFASMYSPEDMDVPEITPGEHEDSPPQYKLTQEDNPDFSSYSETDGNKLHGFCSHNGGKKSLPKDIAVYYGMVTMMDKYIGMILDKLEALNLLDDTLIVFTTDHGHYFGQHGLTAKGAFNYEDLVKIPMVASLRGEIAADTTTDALQCHEDYARTFLSFAGIEAPRSMGGVDQKEVWTGQKKEARDYVVVENHHNPTTVFTKTYIDKRYKLTVYFKQSYGELYDLEQDPGEIKNLWDDANSQAVKSRLMLKLVHAEMANEPMHMPRVCKA